MNRTADEMTDENADFLRRLIVRANEHDKRWRELDRVVDDRRDDTTGDLVQDLIDDKFAQSNLIEAQRNQITALTTILRALGHYTPSDRFKV